MKKVSWIVVIAGAVVGLAAVVLTYLGNPANMGFCIACFLRDITGAVGMHGAAKVQYVRPEIIGLVLGAFVMSVATTEFRAKAGSSPATRFVLGAFVMIGALAFLGCPLRMVLRIGGGDLNAVVGLVGFTLGIFIGIQFLKRGFSLKRAYPVGKGEGGVLPIVMTGLLILVIAVPSLFKFSEEGPGSKHAPMLAALLIAVVVGALAQRARLCMVAVSATPCCSRISSCCTASWPSSWSFWRATSSPAASSWALRCSPSPTAASCGTCWAWSWWAGAACCWAAAPCVS